MGTVSQEQIDQLVAVIQAIGRRSFPVRAPAGGDSSLAPVWSALSELAAAEQRAAEQQTALGRMLEQINAGLTLDQVLDSVYEAFRQVIPYDRIGFALLEEDGERLVSVWVRSEGPVVKIGAGYAAALTGSSLTEVIASGRPRILNDLPAYLRRNPHSASTALIVEEGMAASLTCPLISRGRPFGVIFFSSRQPGAYLDEHVAVFMRIARQLAVIAEKSRLYQQLLELDDLKNKFLGMAAHDLRSPLTVIKGNLDLIDDGLLGARSEQQHAAIVQMQRYCQSMLTLINDFLSVSAIESGKLQLRVQEVALGDFLSEVMSFHRLLAQAKQIELRLAAPADLPVVRLDPERIRQVLNNLLGNAMKFSPPGTAVTLAVSADADGTLWQVTDQGPGIRPEELSRVFDFFAQASTRPTGRESGAGLGLAIVKRLVEVHGGEVWVDSPPGQGARFSFRLPPALSADHPGEPRSPG